MPGLSGRSAEAVTADDESYFIAGKPEDIESWARTNAENSKVNTQHAAQRNLRHNGRILSSALNGLTGFFECTQVPKHGAIPRGSLGKSIDRDCAKATDSFF